MTKGRKAINMEHRLLANWFLDASISVLDVGGGSVSGPKPGWKRAAKQYISVDLYEARDPSIVGDLRCLPFQDKSFDVVLCSQVLEHVYETRPCMSELRRVTKQLCVIDIPFLFPHHSSPEDYWRFTPTCIERLCKDAGFESASSRFLAEETMTWTIAKAA